MGSKGRIPPPHMRHPLPGPGMAHREPFGPGPGMAHRDPFGPGPGMAHHESFGPGMRPPPSGFPPVDMLPPPEILEQKVAAQHIEMERLATENRRLAATHVSLRQQLASAQQELQILDSRIAGVKSEREQQMKGLMERISKMEADLQVADSIKLELQQARVEAQSLAEVRQELITKVQKLTQDLQRAHVDLQQLPALMSELDALRQEYNHCRATYDYEKKLYNDHLESLQVMERNYMTMAREVEKLRAELNTTAGADRRAGYGGAIGYGENDASMRHSSAPNAYGDGYGAAQGHTPLPAASGGVATATSAGGGTPAYASLHSGPATSRPGYDIPRVSGYDPQRASAYDAHVGQAHNAQPQRVPGYNSLRAGGYDDQRAVGFEASRVPSYDPQSRGAGGAPPSQGQAPASSIPYGSAPPHARPGAAYEPPARGGNPAAR